MYGQYMYGTALFGSDAVPPVPEADPIDLMAYLPAYYHPVLEFQALLDSEGVELGGAWQGSGGLLEQFFVDTATWGLAFWEEELGLEIDTYKPAAWRREQINAKLRGTGTTTREMIIATAAAFSGGEVNVIEYPAEYRFVIQFVGVMGIPPNMAGFMRMLDTIKPAHLAYSFLYTYTAWNDLLELSWGEAGSRTWSELRTYGGA